MLVQEGEFTVGGAGAKNQLLRVRCKAIRRGDRRTGPLFAFAGIRTEYRGERGTKSKPISGRHLAMAGLFSPAGLKAEASNGKGTKIADVQSPTRRKFGQQFSRCLFRIKTPF